jgi:hypothetical protein
VRRALAVAAASPIAAVAMSCHSSSQVASNSPDARDAPVGPVLSPQLPVPREEREEEGAFAEAKAALIAWNDATNAHDLQRLASLYDEQVFYYGAYLPKSAVLASKAHAFKVITAYHQEISEVVSDRGEFGNGVDFTKSWGPPDHVRSLRAKIGFRAYDAGSYVIAQETDEPTENAKDLPSTECDWVVYKSVMFLPFVEKRVHAAYDEARDAGLDLGNTGPEADGRGGTMWSFGFGSGPPSKEIVAWVLRRNGEIRLTVDGKVIAMPAAERKAIKEACRPAPQESPPSDP